jgi:Bacterial extracellular solute-binding protein
LRAVFSLIFSSFAIFALFEPRATRSPMQNYRTAPTKKCNEGSEMRPVQFKSSMESSHPPAARSATKRCIVAMLVLFGLGTSVALAGEIRILAAVAVQDPLDRLAAAFTQATGHKVEIGYGLTGPILADIKAGKPVDAVVLPEAGRTGLEDAGLLLSYTPVSASLAGVGVPANAPSPDVSSLEKFTALLRAAPSVSYTDPKSGGAFGQSFDRTLVELGLGGRGSPQGVAGARQPPDCGGGGARRGRGCDHLQERDRDDTRPEIRRHPAASVWEPGAV